MCLIYFATNRKPNRKVNTTDFGKVFSEDGIANLRFGRAEFIEDNSFRLQLEPEKLVPDDRKFGIDHKKSNLGSQRVFSKLRQEMQEQNKDTIIFIHGYNVSFREGLEAAKGMTENFAEIADGRGVNVALFSWPSDGSMFPWLAYASDRRDAAASGPAFARGILKMVDFLHSATRKEACKQRLHLFAHSMGNYVLRHALQEIIRQTGGCPSKVFENIFLVAADEDDDAFEYDHKLKFLPKLGKLVHVYFNREDVALAVSDKTKGNPDRLGEDGPRASYRVPSKVVQVDCTRVVRGVSEHGYYLTNKKVVNDMCAVLNGQEPDEISNRKFQNDRNRYLITAE